MGIIISWTSVQMKTGLRTTKDGVAILASSNSWNSFKIFVLRKIEDLCITSSTEVKIISVQIDRKIQVSEKKPVAKQSETQPQTISVPIQKQTGPKNSFLVLPRVIMAKFSQSEFKEFRNACVAYSASSVFHITKTGLIKGQNVFDSEDLHRIFCGGMDFYRVHSRKKIVYSENGMVLPSQLHYTKVEFEGQIYAFKVEESDFFVRGHSKLACKDIHHLVKTLLTRFESNKLETVLEAAVLVNVDHFTSAIIYVAEKFCFFDSHANASDGTLNAHCQTPG